MNEKLTLTAILIKDPASNGYTSYFAQFPDITAEGDDENSAIDNLLSLSKSVFEKYQSDLSIEKEMPGVKVRKFNFIIERD